MSNTQKIHYAVFGSVITLVLMVIVAMGVSIPFDCTKQWRV